MINYSVLIDMGNANNTNVLKFVISTLVADVPFNSISKPQEASSFSTCFATRLSQSFHPPVTPEPSQQAAQLPESSQKADQLLGPCQQDAHVSESSQQDAHVPESSRQAAHVPEPTQQAVHVPEPTQQAVHVPEPTQQAAHVPGPTQQAAHVPEPTQQAAHVPEPTQQAAHVPEPTQQAASLPGKFQGAAQLPGQFQGAAQFLGQFLWAAQWPGSCQMTIKMPKPCPQAVIPEHYGEYTGSSIQTSYSLWFITNTLVLSNDPSREVPFPDMPPPLSLIHSQYVQNVPGYSNKDRSAANRTLAQPRMYRGGFWNPGYDVEQEHEPSQR